MHYSLCIAEKPSVAKDIARVIGANVRRNGYFEGDGYIVTWAVGHLVGLAEPHEYGFVTQNEMYSQLRDKAYDELPLLPSEWKLIVLENTKDQFKIVKELMHRPDIACIIDCGDMGAEGHILQWFIREKAENTKPVKRFCATDMTDEAIIKAMENLRPINDFESIIRGEFCKKKADWILGMSMSRCATLKYHAGIDIGRVQSPTLYFIVKRWVDVKKFKVTNYYTLQASFYEGFKTYWLKDNDAFFPHEIKDSSGRVLDEMVVHRKANEIKSSGTGTISLFESKMRLTDRPQLYDITELQRDANRIFGYSAAVTLATAQALYESQKVLSYPRTDSRYITSNLQPYMQERIKQIATLQLYQAVANKLLADGLNIDKKIVDDSKVMDHHALIVTNKIDNFPMKMLPSNDEKKKGVTTESLRDILHLVITRMLVSFSTGYQYNETNVNVTFSNGMIFAASGKKPIAQGWKDVQAVLLGKVQLEDDIREEEQIFPSIQKGQVLNVADIEVIPKKTSPPKLHTEATLLTAMENAGASVQGGEILKGKGIGTQATRAEIIKKLFDKEYVKYERGKGKTNYIIPTEKGVSIIKVIPRDLLDPKITADWETKIAAIVDGKYTENSFMEDFISFITNKVEEVKQSNIEGISFFKEREIYGVCPWCKANIYKAPRKDDNGKLIGDGYYCSQKCGFSINTNDRLIEERTGKKLSESQAKKFIAQGSIILDCISKNKKIYKGEFFYEKKSSQAGNIYTAIKMSIPQTTRN